MVIFSLRNCFYCSYFRFSSVFRDFILLFLTKADCTLYFNLVKMWKTLVISNKAWNLACLCGFWRIFAASAMQVFNFNGGELAGFGGLVVSFGNAISVWMRFWVDFHKFLVQWYLKNVGLLLSSYLIWVWFQLFL